MSEASKTVEKVLAVMIELGHGQFVSPQQVARRVGMNRTVAQRLLTTLFQGGYVTRIDGEYALSQRVAMLADLVQVATRRAIAPAVSALSKQLEETVVFQLLDGIHTVVLQESFWERTTSLQVRHEVGSRSLAASSASGLALISLLPDDRLPRFVDGDPDILRERVDAVRRTGFATTTNELQEGVSGLAVGVRGANGPAGSLAVLVPTPRVDELSGYRDQLERAARTIDDALR